MSSQYVDIVSSYEDIDVCEQENNEELKTFNNVVFKDDILQMYLKDIGKIKLLKKMQEQELG